MITVSEQPNRDLLVSISLETPSVYLDHWAVMDFAASDHYARTLRDFIHEKQGTFVLSWANVLEFAAVSKQEAALAETFIDSFFPRVFFLESDMFKESTLREGERPPIVGDIQTAKEIVIRAYAIDKKLSIGGLLQEVQSEFSRALLTANSEKTAEAVRQIVQQMRQDVAKDKLARKETAFSELDSPLRFMRRELLRKLVIAKGEDVKTNDGMDLLHVVKAVAYCTHALLDGQWVTYVNEVKERVRKAGLPDPFAAVYSRRKGGVEQFLANISGGI